MCMVVGEGGMAVVKGEEGESAVKCGEEGVKGEEGKGIGEEGVGVDLCEG